MSVTEKISENRYRIWYTLCFFVLGVIDQRKGSATGQTQMAFSNGVGLVIAAMLLPSVRMEKFRQKVYLIWSIAAIPLGAAAGIWGWHNRIYKGQWIVGVLNVFVWSYLMIYAVRERKTLQIKHRIKQPVFCLMTLMFLLMFFSRHEGILPLWMLLIFGGLLCIGVPEKRREDFALGLMNGIILWFFVQQSVAFGFRPYDMDPRYRGLYMGVTPNGVFYMLTYCAFLCKWIWARERKKRRPLVWFYFLMSSVSISFLLFTGGRSSLFGAAIAAVLIYSLYDIVWKKSFGGWLRHGVLLCLLVVLTFPAVYGGIRYLPTILHHPVWFEGEYSETGSIRSFDPWDSERYITFERAVNANIGRILDLLGIDLKKIQNRISANSWVLKVYASEPAAPGSDPEHPYAPADLDPNDSVEVRKLIYQYYFERLNLVGHSIGDREFQFTDEVRFSHTHNLFLQMAFDYGVIVGALFLILILYCLWRLIRQSLSLGVISGHWIFPAVFTAILCYGLTELALNDGMITWSLLYLGCCVAGMTDCREGFEIKL